MRGLCSRRTSKRIIRATEDAFGAHKIGGQLTYSLCISTDYSLTSAVFCDDVTRALKVARALRYGSAHINVSMG